MGAQKNSPRSPSATASPQCKQRTPTGASVRSADGQPARFHGSPNQFMMLLYAKKVPVSGMVVGFGLNLNLSQMAHGGGRVSLRTNDL
jgi:hypothetical protein